MRLPARLDEAQLVGGDDGPDAVAKPEFGQQPAHMGLHCSLRYMEAGADLDVAQPAGEFREHLPFPLGEARKFAPVVRPPWSAAHITLDETASDARRDEHVTAHDRANAG